MKKTPLRTNATQLTDDELILFDILFDGAATLRLLRRESFRQQWNCDPHNLTDVQLGVTLQQLVTGGLLTTEVHRGNTYFQLTPKGGTLWESERLPTWNRYAIDSYGEGRSGRPNVTIAATTSNARDEFWTIGRDSGFFVHSTGRIRRSTIKNHELIPWKTFPRLYVLVAILDAWSGPLDWEDLESRRTWWRNVHENEKFRSQVK